MTTKQAIEQCKCKTWEECKHLVPLKLDPEKIQEGDFANHHPTGQMSYILGVDTKSGKVCSVDSRVGLVELVHCVLVKKGIGITQYQHRHRRKAFGAGWDNEHALEASGDKDQAEDTKPEPLAVREPKKAPPPELGEELGTIACCSAECEQTSIVREIENYPGQMMAACPDGHEHRLGVYWRDRIKKK